MQIPSAYLPPETRASVSVSVSRRAFQTAVALSILMSIGAFVAIPFVQPEVPIFYTLAQPERQLVPKGWLLLFPAIAWFITLLHFALIKSFHDLEKKVQALFCWVTVGLVGITGLLLARVIAIVL